MSDTNSSLKESIEKAANDQNNSSDPKTHNEGDNNSRQEKDEKKNEISDSEDSNESDSDKGSDGEDSEHEINEEVETGVALLRALRDPKQAKGIVQDLAVRLGMINSGEKPTPSEVKDIKSILKETLADDYPDLKEKLEVVLGKVQEENDSKLRSLEAKLLEAEKARSEREFMGTYDKFIKDNKIDDSVAEKMIREMQLIPPGPKITLVQYLNKIHSLVSASTNEAKQKLRTAEKIQTNLKDSAVKNLSSDVSDNRISKGSHRPSIKEAISMALDEQRK